MLDQELVAVLVDLREELVVEDLVDAVAGEQAHEVVLGREVEARLARVALAAEPRSWLSIRRDSCRSVPQMKRPPASFTFCGPPHLLLHLREQLVPGAVPLVGVRLEAALRELELREVLLVAAELDVTPRPAMLVAIVTANGGPPRR